MPHVDLDIWFHLTIELLDDPCERVLAGAWDETFGAPDENKQQTYFHRVVAEALWGPANAPGKAALRVFNRRACGDAPWIAEWWGKGKSKDDRGATQFQLKILAATLQILRPASPALPLPGLGILSVNVKVAGVRHHRPGEAEADFKGLTINDALDALNCTRRVFARRFRGAARDIPENALARVFRAGGAEHRMPTGAEQKAYGADHETPQVAAWVAELLAPIRIDGKTAALFGDERASMTSFVAPEVPEGQTPVDAFRAIHDSVFFRLAEVDSGGAGYPSQPEFLNDLRAGYFVDRHAPSPEPHDGENPKNSTRWITGPNHLCGIGTGDFARDYGVENNRRYYRFIHLLCLLEQHRLLQFSRQIADLVARKGGLSPAEFRAELLALRGAFLDFTHRLHFTTISAQALPEDLYARLYRVMGLDRLYAAVESELGAAADYAALQEAGEAARRAERLNQEADEAARRAERLNNVVALGVPVALVVGALGMNILVGDRFPPVFDGWVCVREHPFRYDLFQTSTVIALVLTLWYLGNRYILDHGADVPKPVGRWWWAMIGAWVVALCMLLSFAEVRGPCKTPDPGSASHVTGPPGAGFAGLVLGRPV